MGNISETGTTSLTIVQEARLTASNHTLSQIDGLLGSVGSWKHDNSLTPKQRETLTFHLKRYETITGISDNEKIRSIKRARILALLGTTESSSPINPDQIDPEEIKKLKTEDRFFRIRESQAIEAYVLSGRNAF